MTNTTVQRTGFGAMALAAAVLVLINWNVPADENGGVSEMLAALAISGVAALLLFGWAIPRAVEAGPERAARRGIALGVAGVVTVVAFWTGLPFVLGGAALALGTAARQRGGQAGGAAVALGALAVAGAIAITVVDQLS